MENKFRADLRKIPLCFTGREKMINEIIEALHGDGSDPNLTSIFVGEQGTGKTVLLSYLSDIASESRWITVNLSCTSDMLNETIVQLSDKAGELIHAECKNNRPSTWTTAVDKILEQLTAQDTGVLFMIDELKNSVKEMTYFMTAYQYFVAEKRKVGLLMTGLPFNVSKLLENNDVTFIRHAFYKNLEKIPDAEDANIYWKPM